MKPKLTKAWTKSTQKELKKKSTRYEKIVFDTLPPVLKYSAKTQQPFKKGSYRYFFDIFIAEFKVAIEVDGGYHGKVDQEKFDRIRDFAVSQFGIKTFRITNADVKNQDKLKAFLNGILAYCHLNNDADSEISLLTMQLKEVKARINSPECVNDKKRLLELVKEYSQVQSKRNDIVRAEYLKAKAARDLEKAKHNLND